MSFRVNQISDTHIGSVKNWFTVNVNEIGAAMRDEAPDLVINTGDLSVNGADDLHDLVEAKRVHDALGLPYRVIPGNHDIGDTQAVARHQPINPERRDRFVSVFGADWWQQDVPGWRLIGINAQLLGSDLDAAEEQLAFLQDSRSDITDRAIALFVHKPLFHHSASEDALLGYFVNPADRHDVLAALGDSLKLVVCGHIHQFRDTTVNGVRHIWGPPTAFILSPEFQADYGERTVGYVAHEFHADGTHDCRLVAPAGATPFDLADFPQAYGNLRERKAASKIYESGAAKVSA